MEEGLGTGSILMEVWLFLMEWFNQMDSYTEYCELLNLFSYVAMALLALPLLLMVSTAVRLLTRMVSHRLAMWDCTLGELVSWSRSDCACGYIMFLCAGAGVVSISEDPQFSLVSEDPLEFTLTSTTTGGPPTTAFWTLPSSAMASGDQELLNGLTATVRHTLTVTERLTGDYMFSTTNLKSGAPDSSSITLEGNLLCNYVTIIFIHLMRMYDIICDRC